MDPSFQGRYVQGGCYPGADRDLSRREQGSTIDPKTQLISLIDATHVIKDLEGIRRRHPSGGAGRFWGGVISLLARGIAGRW